MSLTLQKELIYSLRTLGHDIQKATTLHLYYCTKCEGRFYIPNTGIFHKNKFYTDVTIHLTRVNKCPLQEVPTCTEVIIREIIE